MQSDHRQTSPFHSGQSCAQEKTCSLTKQKPESQQSR